MVAKSARFMAPVALVVVAAAIYVVIHSNLSHSAAPVAHQTSAIVNGRRQVVKHRHTARFYVVRPGDTLSQIAVRTGVGIGQILTLNPAVAASPDSLQAGQRLRLQR
jgi:hypothetical protein